MRVGAARPHSSRSNRTTHITRSDINSILKNPAFSHPSSLAPCQRRWPGECRYFCPPRCFVASFLPLAVPFSAARYHRLRPLERRQPRPACRFSQESAAPFRFILPSRSVRDDSGVQATLNGIYDGSLELARVNFACGCIPALNRALREPGPLGTCCVAQRPTTQCVVRWRDWACCYSPYLAAQGRHLQGVVHHVGAVGVVC